MLEFFIMFIIIGFFIGILIKDESSCIASIIIISVLWSFAFGPWAIATLIELMLGYGIAKKIGE